MTKFSLLILSFIICAGNFCFVQNEMTPSTGWKDTTVTESTLSAIVFDRYTINCYYDTMVTRATKLNLKKFIPFAKKGHDLHKDKLEIRIKPTLNCPFIDMVEVIKTVHDKFKNISLNPLEDYEEKYFKTTSFGPTPDQ